MLYALSYFIPFYLSHTTRPSPTLSRDAPSVIRARIRSVTLSCLTCTGLTYVVLSRAGAGTDATTPREALHLLGLWPPALWDSLRALSLTALLFAGPLFSYLVVERGWADWLRLTPVKEVWSEWTVWRNIIAVRLPPPTRPNTPLPTTTNPPPTTQGPITEEILFRTASIPLMLLAQTPATRTIFLTPIIFGLAHVHHFYEFRLTHPQVPAAAALLRSLLQLAYTTLFGAYATFLFLRTGSLAAVCVVHAFCNCMGLPQVWGRVGGPAEEEVGNGGPQQRKGAAGKRPTVLFTLVYYVLLVAGAVMWWRNLWVLSESENALVPTEAFSKQHSA